jgi:hypothetical protein
MRRTGLNTLELVCCKLLVKDVINFKDIKRLGTIFSNLLTCFG